MMKKFLVFMTVFFIFSLFLSLHENAGSNTGYVGVDTCKGCHEEIYNSYTKSAHGKKAVAESPANKAACESCHGPGNAHVEKGGGRGVGILGFGKDSKAAEKAGRCLECHENSRLLTFWDAGIHKKNDVACSDCHSIHKQKADVNDYKTCVRCHKSIKAEINKRSHHPIVEGKVKCSNCHNPHGTSGPSMIQADSVNELCYSCHAEKRGPYLWEHPPVEENCLNCHTPHGSTHAKLNVEKIPNLCQACHDWSRHPGTRYGNEADFTGSSTSNRFVARSCVNCHSEIHGSNAPAHPETGKGYNAGSKFVR